MTDWPAATWDHGGHRLIHADCLTALPTLPADSVTALVTDPPAGIGFMGKEWDSFGGRVNGNADTDRAEANATLAAKGPKRERGTQPFGYSGSSVVNPGQRQQFIAFLSAVARECLRVVKPGGYGLVWAIPRTSHWTATALEDAGWEIRDRISHLFGQGFPKAKSCLKPACEDWWLVRKPGRKVGPLNIDGCRIGTEPILSRKDGGFGAMCRDDEWKPEPLTEYQPHAGRWPANVTLDESAAAELDLVAGEHPGAVSNGKIKGNGFSGPWGPVEQTPGHADTGGPSRYFYVAKADRSDRERGNSHPTVKSTALMRWLVRLVTPEGGIVLDPFMGSGSTGKAAVRERCQFVGIEREEKYYRSAVKRVYRAVSEPDLFKSATESPPPPETADLFGETP